MASDTRADRRRHGPRHGRSSTDDIAVVAGRQRRGPDALAAAVAAAADAIEATLPTTLMGITFQIEDVPTAIELRGSRALAPLGRQIRGNPSVVTLYRRPIEARAHGGAELNRLVRDTVAELVGQVAGVAPERVIPEYGQGS